MAIASEVETVVIGRDSVRCVPLPRLIAMKRAAGRPKGLDMLAGLEALLDERTRSDSA